MKSHELAQLLLKNPNLPVMVHTVNGFEQVTKIEVEDKDTLLDLNQNQNRDGIYQIRKTSNDDPEVILISDSFGLV